MKERGIEPSEHSQAGWINAALLVEGIKAAGDDFTRQSVIDAINCDHRLHRRRHPAADRLEPERRRPRDVHEACDAYVEAQSTGSSSPCSASRVSRSCASRSTRSPTTSTTPYYRPAEGRGDRAHDWLPLDQR